MNRDQELMLRLKWAVIADSVAPAARPLVNNLGVFEAEEFVSELISGKREVPKPMAQSFKKLKALFLATQGEAVWEKIEKVSARDGGRYPVRCILPGDDIWPKGLSRLGHDMPLMLFARCLRDGKRSIGEGADSEVSAGDPATTPSGSAQDDKGGAVNDEGSTVNDEVSGRGGGGAQSSLNVLKKLERNGVAVVGSRNCSGYGKQLARTLGFELVQRGFVNVSGGAFGIDCASHLGAAAALVEAKSLGKVRVGGNIAFIASGIDNFTPAGNHEMFKRLLESGGVVLSEHPPKSPMFSGRFLERNRLIAASTSGTVTVEAAWRSGALSTTAYAKDMGLPFGAFPGSVLSGESAGCHQLIRNGAQLLSSVEDVIEMVSESFDVVAERHSELLKSLSVDEKEVYSCLHSKAQTEESIAKKLKTVDKARLRGLLGVLSLKGVVDVREGAGIEPRKYLRSSDG